MDNLASKYRPKTFDDVVEQSVVAEILHKICTTDPLTIRNFLLIGPAGTGKALRNGSKVAMADTSYKCIEDLHVGDLVIDRHGVICSVDGVYPQGAHPIYKVVLSDSSSIEIADNHLNCVWYQDSHGMHYEHAMPTPDLLARFNSGESLYVETCFASNHRKIESISYVGEHDCTCIHVTSEDHTFVVEGMIPTHNTTQAKIMARVLNGDDYVPIEIDGASHGGVEAIRNIIEQARSYPIGYKYKVFIIDECHALSSGAWQALLLTLESSPAASIFIFCTTNPEKIPQTILSRVQTFQLTKISLKGIHDRLVHILECEKAEGRQLTYDDDAVSYISKLAGGGLRDSITLLDKALAYNSDVTTANIEKALNLPNYDTYFALLNAIAKKDNKTIIEIIHTVYNSGINFVKFFEGFLSFVSNIVKYIYLKDINATMIPSHYADKIANYGTAHAALCLKLSNKLVKLNQELKTTQYLQELAISYLCPVPEKR